MYLDDPLICPKCAGTMKILAFIEQDDVIAKILKHFGLWELLNRLATTAHAPPLDFVEYYAEEYSGLLPAEYEYEAWQALRASRRWFVLPKIKPDVGG